MKASHWEVEPVALLGLSPASFNCSGKAYSPGPRLHMRAHVIYVNRFVCACACVHVRVCVCVCVCVQVRPVLFSRFDPGFVVFFWHVAYVFACMRV